MKSADGRKLTKKEARKAIELAESARIMEGEDPAEYQELLDHWMTEHPPRNPEEEQIVRYAVDLVWKIRRAERQENELAHRRVLDAIASCEADDIESLERAATLAMIDLSADGAWRFRRSMALNREFCRIALRVSKVGK
jgi:hypothetical protein